MLNMVHFGQNWRVAALRTCSESDTLWPTMGGLGVNIDHVATLRQARRTYEPDPVWAAVEAQLAGAECITVHLREDRRHIQDHDVDRLKSMVEVKFNLEMAATPAMVELACKLKPDMATLVPEGRQEVTTEGGLNVATQIARLTDVATQLKEAGVTASAFIDAEPEQIDASAKAGFDYCEIHTGPYALLHKKAAGSLTDSAVKRELERIADAGRRIVDAGMQFNAGHALTYGNVTPIAALAGLCELHIGHSIVSRSVFVGFREAVSQMRQLIREAAVSV